MKFLNAISYDHENTVSLLKDSIDKYVVSHLTDVPTDLNLEILYSDIASQIGLFLNTDLDPNTARILNNTWGEVRFDKEKAETAYRYSNKQHPLHTDHSTISVDLGISFLICEQAAVSGGETLFLDQEVLLKHLEKYDPGLLHDLTSIPIEMERPGPSPTRHISRIIDTDDQGLILNWNYFRVADSNTDHAKDIAERFHTFLNKNIVERGLTYALNLKKGEGVFFHDNRVLHGRNAFKGDRFLKKGTIVIDNIEAVKKVFQ